MLATAQQMLSSCSNPSMTHTTTGLEFRIVIKYRPTTHWFSDELPRNVRDSAR